MSGGGMSGGGMSGGGMPGGGFGGTSIPGSAGRVNAGGGRQAGVANPRWGDGGAAGREGRPDGSSFGRSAVDDQMAGRSAEAPGHRAWIRPYPGTPGRAAGTPQRARR